MTENEKLDGQHYKLSKKNQEGMISSTHDTDIAKRNIILTNKIEMPLQSAVNVCTRLSDP